MKDKIFEAITKYKMIGDNGNIVVAVSGGADSMCLLHFLYNNKSELGINTLVAAHVNHNIRGGEAKRDELFVEQFCENNHIRFRLLSADIPAISRQKKIGIEETARKVRYEFFDKLSKEYGAVVATAHNANDNAETMIYNLTRGSGLKGICGIPPKRDYIIRPLITVTREEIERYCVDNDLSFVTDSTNLSDEYTRNKIRHNILPILSQLNPSFQSSMSRASQLLRQDDEFLFQLANEVITNSKVNDGYNVSVFREQNKSVLSRVVMILLDRGYGIKVDYNCISSVCNAIYNGSRVNICGDLYADAHSGVFRLYKEFEKKEVKSATVYNAKKAELNGRRVEFEVVDKKEFDRIAKFNNLLFKFAIDYDIINAVTVLRTRKSGDVFSPNKRKFTKSLKKFFIDEKVVSEKRDSIFLIANGSDVLWLEGFGASKNAAVNSKSNRVLLIKTNNLPKDESDDGC